MTRQSIAIIGGGPVGLFTAFLLMDSHNVTIFEKRTKYTRSEKVSIDIGRLGQVATKLGFRLPGLQTRTSIRDLENSLRAQLITHGTTQGNTQCTIVTKEITDGLVGSEFNTVIICDGYNSQNRQFVTQEQHQTKLQTAVLCSRPGLKPEPYLVRLYHMLRSGVIHISNQDSLSVVLDHQCVDPIAVVQKVFTSRGLGLVSAKSVKIVSLESSMAGKISAGNRVLLGDACCGVPFRKGLSVGLQCSLQLCHHLISRKSLQEYSMWAKQFIAKQDQHAWITSKLIDVRRDYHHLIGGGTGLLETLEYDSFLILFFLAALFIILSAMSLSL